MWKHFLYSAELGKAKCKVCLCEFKTSSTTGVLLNHLENKHGVSIKRRLMGDITNSIPQKTIRLEDGSAASSTSEHQLTLGEVIARFVSKDGFSFNQIAKSELLHKFASCAGFVLPKSPQRIRDIFIEEYRKTLAVVKGEIKEQKEQKKRFSISLDESTTKRNRR